MDLSRYSSTEDIQMDNKHRDRCSTLLVIREIQIKIMKRYHFVPAMMATIKKRGEEEEEGTSVGEDVEKLLIHHWWAKIVQLLWKIVWWLTKKLNTELPHDPTIPLLDIYRKELKAETQITVCQCSL